MWGKLKITYEGTNEVKEITISLLMYEYELFQMKKEKTLKACFLYLVRSLEN